MAICLDKMYHSNKLKISGSGWILLSGCTAAGHSRTSTRSQEAWSTATDILMPKHGRPEQTAVNDCFDEVIDDVIRLDLETKGALHMAAHAYIFQTNLPT